MLQKRETTATTRKKNLTTEKWLVKTLGENFILSPGGGHSVIWAIRGSAAGQGMVFWPRCPKQGI